MHFTAAVDELTRSITHDDVARAAGISTQLVRQARLDPQSAGYRTPPDDWPITIARLARKRAAELVKLAEHLESDGR